MDKKVEALKVHPAAALFPMMSEPELVDLAADIKASGLIHPVMLGTWEEEGETIEGLIDGRNRLKACRMAEVEPRFDKLNGQDPLAYIISVNVERRSLTAGQKAIATALIHPEPAKLKRKGDVKILNNSERVMLSNARAIVRWSRERALDVLNGVMPFDKALGDAGDANKAALINRVQIERLRNEAPDLAEEVERGDLTPLEGTAKLDARIEQARLVKENQWRSMIDRTQSGYQSLCGWVSDESTENVLATLDDPAFVAQMAFLVRLDPKDIDDLAHGLENLTRVLRTLTEKGGTK